MEEICLEKVIVFEMNSTCGSIQYKTMVNCVYNETATLLYGTLHVIAEIII